MDRSKCPKCGSKEFSADTPWFREFDELVVECECEECHHKFTHVFHTELVDIEEEPNT